MNSKKIGERIKNARKSKRFSQMELGELLGVSGSMIGQYETGKRVPKLETLEKIAKALEIPTLSLLPPIDANDPDDQKTFWRYIKNGKVELPGLVDSATVDMVERRDELLYNFNKLNEKGQNKAVEQVSDLAKIPEYQKDSQ